MSNIANPETTKMYTVEYNTQTDTKQHPVKSGLSDNLTIDKIISQKVPVHPVHQIPTNWQLNPPQIIYVIQQQQQASQVNCTATPTIISNPPTHSIQDSEQNEKAVQRKICDKEHIIWIFTFLLMIYDFITDVQISLKWFELPSLCSQFKCQPSESTSTGYIYSAAFYVITCSVIGVVAGLIIKIKEAKSLYFVFKHPISKSDLVFSNLKRWRFYMFVGWIPVIIEDGVSLFYVLALYSTTQYYVGMESVYLRSIILSILSILFAIMNSTRKRCKMRTRNVYKCARCCHCCWCSCISIYVIFMCLALLQSVLIMSDRGTTTSPLVNIKTDNEFCSVYNRGWSDIDDDVNEFEGELLENPIFLYPNCSGLNYEYELTCLENDVVDDIILHCSLEWEYKYMVDNISEIDKSNLHLYEQFFCYNDDEDSCLFDVELETCDVFPINCNNKFNFSDGNPVMWVCFEYCVA
eukprot:134774_1